MDTQYKQDRFLMLRYAVLAIKNLKRRLVRTALTVAGVGLAVAVAVSLGGFVLGYRTAIDHSIEMLGFQVMIMAKGCPYEAATMMLKGGTGLLYLPSDTFEKVKNDASIDSITPIFVGIAQKEASGIRDEGSEKTFTVINGIDVPSFLSMKPWLKFKDGPGYAGGKWFAQTSKDEIVLGYEIAEYEQRKVGDLIKEHDLVFARLRKPLSPRVTRPILKLSPGLHRKEARHVIPLITVNVFSENLRHQCRSPPSARCRQRSA